MKSLFLSLFFISFFSFSQTKEEPIYYVDSIQVIYKNIFIDPNNIKNIYVEKKRKKEGEIFINLKKGINLKPLKEYVNYKLGEIIFIDNQLIKNPSIIFVDQSFNECKINKIPSSEIENIPKEVSIIFITSKKEIEKNNYEIRIR